MPRSRRVIGIVIAALALVTGVVLFVRRSRPQDDVYARDGSASTVSDKAAIHPQVHASARAVQPKPDERAGTAPPPPAVQHHASAADPTADAVNWETMNPIPEFDPRVGSAEQRMALTQQLRRAFTSITDKCFEEWQPPQSLALKDGIVPVRIGLALGIATRNGATFVRHASVEKANLSDTSLEECLVNRAVGTELTLPHDYKDAAGGLRSLPALSDGTMRLSYPLAIGVPGTWAHRPRH